MATRTLAAYVAVGKETPRLLVVELLADLLDELAVVVELAEEVAGKTVVDFAGGAAVDVERYAEPLEGVLY